MTPGIGEEGPMGTDSAAIFVRLRDAVGADRDEPAIADLELTMELEKPFGLAAVLRAETSAAEDENHRMLALQLGELPSIPRVVGELVVGKDGPRNDVSAHGRSPLKRANYLSPLPPVCPARLPAHRRSVTGEARQL